MSIGASLKICVLALRHNEYDKSVLFYGLGLTLRHDLGLEKAFCALNHCKSFSATCLVSSSHTADGDKPS